MPAHVTPNVRPTDDLAEQFKRIMQRLASLERSVSTVAGGVDVVKLPRGWVGQATPTADQTGIGSTLTDVTNMSVTWTADPTRRYRTSMVLTAYPSVGPATLLAYITNAAGTLIRRCYFTVPTANYYAELTVFMVESGLSGTQTRKVQASTSAGTLTIWSASTAAMILVEDIGGI